MKLKKTYIIPEVFIMDVVSNEIMEGSTLTERPPEEDKEIVGDAKSNFYTYHNFYYDDYEDEEEYFDYGW